MSDHVTIPDVDVDEELEVLAARYRAASGVGVQLLNLLGGQAEGLIDKLPVQVRNGLGTATEQALKVAMQTAHKSRDVIPDQKSWVNTAAITALGAAGGLGGLPSALVELPATTTALLRTIQGVAVEYGFDPDAENVQFDCIQVFASAGPLSKDDGADLGFLSVRLTLTGGAMQKLIGMVAPRLAAVLGQKLAAQSVPVLGALAGATANYVYTSYYQQVAHVHFGLRKLAIDADISQAELLERLERKMKPQLT